MQAEKFRRLYRAVLLFLKNLPIYGMIIDTHTVVMLELCWMFKITLWFLHVYILQNIQICLQCSIINKIYLPLKLWIYLGLKIEQFLLDHDCIPIFWVHLQKLITTEVFKQEVSVCKTLIHIHFVSFYSRFSLPSCLKNMW